MTTKALPTRYRRAKKILIVLAAIVGFPFAIIILLASLNEGRR